MIKIPFFCALGLNSLAVIFFFLYAYRPKGRFFNAATLYLFLGTLSLSLMLLLSGLAENRHPSTSTFDSLNFLAFLILFIYFVAEYKFKIRMLGTLLPPLALLLIILSLTVPKTSFQIEGFYSPSLFSIHTAFALLGEACFALSFTASLIYLIQERNLKRKHFKGLFFKLPSLPLLEKTASFSLLLGFPFLTIGVFLGFLLAADKLGGNWVLDPKIIWTMTTWLVYAILFTRRVSGQLRGRKFVLFLIFGFFLVIACYVVANRFSSFHNFIYSYGVTT